MLSAAGLPRGFVAGLDVNESTPRSGQSLALAGKPIYHTNVLMCVATEFAMVGFDVIPDARQIAEFAGNAIELSGRDGRILALSQRAYASLSEEQKCIIERYARLLPLAVPTVEMTGGSVRCMIAGVHLLPRR